MKTKKKPTIKENADCLRRIKGNNDVNNSQFQAQTDCVASSKYHQEP